MLRFRNKDGKAFKAPEGIVSVEMCDDAGNPAVVLLLHSRGHVSMYKAGEPEFARYCLATGAVSSSLRELADGDVWDGSDTRGPSITQV